MMSPAKDDLIYLGRLPNLSIDALDDYFEVEKANVLLDCMRSSILDQELGPCVENTLPYTTSMLLQIVNYKLKNSQNLEACRLDSVQHLIALLVIFFNTLDGDESKVKSFLEDNQDTILWIIQALIQLPFSVYSKMEKDWNKSKQICSINHIPSVKHQFAFTVINFCFAITRKLVKIYGTHEWWIRYLQVLFPPLWKTNVEDTYADSFISYLAILDETVHVNYANTSMEIVPPLGFPCESLVSKLFETICDPSINVSSAPEKILYSRNLSFCNILDNYYQQYLLRIPIEQISSGTSINNSILSWIQRSENYMTLLYEAISKYPAETHSPYLALLSCSIRLSAALANLCSVWKYRSLELPLNIRPFILQNIRMCLDLANLFSNADAIVVKTKQNAILQLKLSTTKCFAAADLLQLFPLIDNNPKHVKNSQKIIAINLDMLDSIDSFLTNDDPRTFTQVLVPIANWCHEMYMDLNNVEPSEMKLSGAMTKECKTVDVSRLVYKIWSIAGAFIRGEGRHIIKDAGSNEFVDYFKEITQPKMLKNVWMGPFMCEAILLGISRCRHFQNTTDFSLFTALQQVAKNVIPRLCNAFVFFHTDPCKKSMEDRVCFRIASQRMRTLQNQYPLKECKTMAMVLRKTRADFGNSPAASFFSSIRHMRPKIHGETSNEQFRYTKGIILHTILAHIGISADDDLRTIILQLVLTLRESIDGIFEETFFNNLSQKAGNLTALIQICVTLSHYIEKKYAIQLIEALMLKVNQLLFIIQSPFFVSGLDGLLKHVALNCNFLALFLIRRYDLHSIDCIKRKNYVQKCSQFICTALLELAEVKSISCTDFLSLSVHEPISILKNQSILRMLLRELVPHAKDHGDDKLRRLCEHEKKMMHLETKNSNEELVFPSNHVFGFNGGENYWNLYPVGWSPGSVTLAALRLRSFSLFKTDFKQEIRSILHTSNRESAKKISPDSASRQILKPEICKPMLDQVDSDPSIGDRVKRTRESDTESTTDEKEADILGEQTKKRARRSLSSRDGTQTSGSSKGTQNVNATGSLFRKLYNSNCQRKALLKKQRKRSFGGKNVNFRAPRSVYTSTRAKGDMKKPNLPEPYAYFPL